LAPKKSLLEQMKANPAGDWKMKDVEKLCRQNGIDCEPPAGGGSHFKVFSQYLEGTITIVSGRPIKVVYINNLTSYVEAHCRCRDQKG
jgi:hypothetical protein